MEHGGDIYTDGVLKGKDLMDFSSNINPLGAPEGFKKNICEAIENVDKYPDIEYRELKKSIKNYLENYDYYFGKNTFKSNVKLELNNIVLGNGASEIIDMAISCFKSICIVVPSFIEYEKNALKWGCSIVYSKLNSYMNLDYEDILEKIKHVQCLIIGNPNNPNGQVIDKKKFKTILNYCEENEKTIIIDEAFVEFTGNASLSFLNEIENYNCLFIVRALTKFFALPGIRFGYGISKNKNIIFSIKRKQNPWNINCFAETAAKYVLNDCKYISKSLNWIASERKFMEENLKKINIIDRVYTTYSNFVLCRLLGVDSHELYEFCLKKGALIRKCENFRGLDKRYIRLAIKDREKK
jgi:threonine-phosphate decarboxylase